MLDKITYLFPNVNVCTVWEWIGNSPIIYNWCNYVSMLGWKLNHANKRGSRHTSCCDDVVVPSAPWIETYVVIMRTGQRHAVQIVCDFIPYSVSDHFYRMHVIYSSILDRAECFSSTGTLIGMHQFQRSNYEIHSWNQYILIHTEQEAPRERKPPPRLVWEAWDSLVRPKTV